MPDMSPHTATAPPPGFGPTRVFRAPSMRDAFLGVKAQIGPDAVILNTRDLGSAVGDDQRFEVIAAWPAARPSQFTSEDPGPRTRRDTTLPDATRIETQNERLHQQLRQLEQAVRGLEAQLQHLGGRRRDDVMRPAGAASDPTAASLVAAGIEPSVASALAERAARRAAPRHGLAVAKDPDIGAEIERAIKPGTPLWALPSGSVAALIGPSGGGKTTTLLKLAGLTAFAHKKSVALISTDLVRLGAYESLARYAQVMDLPIAAAGDKKELDDALDRFADKDLVLIDTPGHNPFDPDQRFWALKPVSGREVRHHVVLPATLSPSLVADTLAAYEGPALASLIVTRLDEARGPSALLAASLAAELPVSHIADGRQIPDDIRAVDPNALARQLLEKAS